MDKPEFKISRFKNRTGSVSWRVTGYLHGNRVRKNVPTREEAVAERAALEIKAIQASSGQRAVVTSLSDIQLREAESLFHRATGKPRTLTFYVDYALANYREPEHQKRVTDAVSDYVAAKKREFEEDQLTKLREALVANRQVSQQKQFEHDEKSKTLASVRA